MLPGDGVGHVDIKVSLEQLRYCSRAARPLSCVRECLPIRAKRRARRAQSRRGIPLSFYRLKVQKPFLSQAPRDHPFVATPRRTIMTGDGKEEGGELTPHPDLSHRRVSALRRRDMLRYACLSQKR